MGTKSMQRKTPLFLARMAFLITCGALAAAVARFIADFVEPRITPVTPLRTMTEIERQMDDFRSQMALVTSILETVQQTLNTAMKDPNSLALVGLQADIKQVSLEVKSVRDALGSDLERTLSVPLLRKDIQKLEEQFAERTIAASREIDRIYDQNKWFLGLMGTMAVGLLGLVISNLLQMKGKKADA